MTAPGSDVPFVTVQLPIYNEMYVVDRLVDAVARLDYPQRPARRSRCSTTRPTTPSASRAHAVDSGGRPGVSTSNTCIERIAPDSRPAHSRRDSGRREES